MLQVLKRFLPDFAPQPMTHESGYSSSGRSPGNILEDRPSSPEDDDRHSARNEQVKVRFS